MDDKLKDLLTENKEMDIEKKIKITKFLSGEMSFADYSSEWYTNDSEDTEDIENAVRQIDDEHQQSSTPSERVRRNRRATKLPPALLALMGEANLRFARGEVDHAVKICHEIIAQVPTASEPYKTLAQIYENDKEKNWQFSLLAAHLGPTDSDEWLRLAAISKQMGKIRQEMVCYTQAINAQPYNLEMHLIRLDALTKFEEMKYPTNTLGVIRVKCYHRVVNCLPPSEAESIMKYANLAVTIYHNSNEIDRALEVLSAAYKKCSSHFSYEDLNIFLELLITQKQFQTCLEIFVANVGVEIEAEILTVENSNSEIEEQTNYLNCSIPDGLPIDLKSKLLVCFINLGAINLVKTLLTEFLTNDVDKAGDLFMDIEEALSSLGYFDLALKLIEPLVLNVNFDLGAVWLKHAECLHNLGRNDEAITSYYKVLKHAPQHPDARQKLYSILEKKGRIDDALNSIQQNHKNVVSLLLLYDQCKALKKHDRKLKYLEVGEALLSKTFIRYRHLEEVKIAFKLKSGHDTIHLFRTERGEYPYNDDDIQFVEDEAFKLSPQEEWDLFKDLLKIAYEYKLYHIMQRLSFGAVGSKTLNSRRSEIEFYCLQSSLLNNDPLKAFRFIREFTIKNPCPRTWNILNLVVSSLEENTHSKFMSRLVQRENNVIKSLFMGNNFLVSGRYVVALKYFFEYHDQYKDPLSALLIAITILAMASQRTVDKHHNLVVQGISYLLTYQKLRQCDQETYYNIGRAYHMLSINNLAVEYYEKALASSDVTQCERHGVINLTRETAYNLYLLYKETSPLTARKYLLKYLVIE